MLPLNATPQICTRRSEMRYSTALHEHLLDVRESNSQSPGSEPGAITIMPTSNIVRCAGFEPAIDFNCLYQSQNLTLSTKLSQHPIFIISKNTFFIIRTAESGSNRHTSHSQCDELTNYSIWAI